MPSTAHVSAEQRHAIWNEWLDGDTVNRIHRYQVGELSKAVIKTVLDEEPPESIMNDARLVHGGRFFWISVSHSYPKTADGEKMVFVVAKMPYRMPGKAFASGLRAIRRDFRTLHPESDLNLGVVEGIEAEVALKFLNSKGFLGWSMEVEGSISRLLPSEPEDAPTGLGMHP